MSDANINDTIYTETIADLRAKIESKYESLSAFCKIAELDKLNLYKVFNGTNGQEMSIGTYAKILTAFGVPGLEAVVSNLSLKQYLRIDNNAILKSILLIKFS